MIRLRVLAVRMSFAIACFLPLRRRVVFATSHDPAIRGNLAVIRDALQTADPVIPFTILTKSPRGYLPGKIRALWGSALAGYHLATARLFVVDDYFFPIYVVRPRPGTTIVQTWHACGAFKKFGLSVLDKSFGATESLTRRVRIHSNYDLCLVSSRACAVHYAEAFGQPMDLFVTDLGIPRTDALFDPTVVARATETVRARYAVARDKRVILYAPTFRGTAVHRATSPKNLDIALLHRELGADHVLLMRLHPFVREDAPIPPGLGDFAIDVSDHPDIHELMHVTDVLVTDYSSAIFEFSLLNRPMAFFAPDHQDYDDERGFYFDFRTGVPGPIFETTAELARWLRAGEFDLERVARFRAESFEVADGHATERFVDRIVLPALA
jgi:teichoic acid ribitol-phosphate primase